MDDLVLVEWVDSRGSSGGWEHVTEVMREGICLMLSVGWIIRQNDDGICIAPHCSTGDELMQVCGVMNIPKKCITAIKPLKKGRNTL